MITSCGGSTRPQETSNHPNKPIPLAQPIQKLDLAPQKGINNAVMDNYLAILIQDASKIEDQIKILNSRLKYIRSELSEYQLKNIDKHHIDTVATDLKIRQKPVLEPDNKPRPKVHKVAKKPAMPKPQANTKHYGKQGVINLRIGKHSDKTRLVLDINGSIAHSFSFDKEAGFITLMLNNTKWATKNSEVYKSGQLAGYQAQDQGQGSIIAFAVSNTKDVKVSTIKKTSGKPARIIIDLIK